MQTALLRLLERDTAFESEAHMRNWLIRVAINESRKILRGAWRRHIFSLNEGLGCPAFDNTAQRELFDAVMHLPRNDRMVIYLFYYEEMTTEEIACILSVKPTTIRSRLMRARQKLKELTEESFPQNETLKEVWKAMIERKLFQDTFFSATLKKSIQEV